MLKTMPPYQPMAALSVVRKRLEEDGLGRFCLELHSAKASKKEVLLQLEAALKAPPARTPADWEQICRELGVTRTQLNAYVREMHQERASGETIYQVLGRLVLLGDGPRAMAPEQSGPSTTAEQLEETLARHFAGQTDLLVVSFDAEALGPALKWEPSRGGQLFPHLYGPLPTHLALSVTPR